MCLHNARLSLILVIALLAPGMVPAAPHNSPAAAAADAAAGTMLFIENAGQWPAEARFQAWGSPLGTGTTWLTEDAIWVTIVNRSIDPLVCYGWGSDLDAAEPQITSSWQGTNLKLSFLGANRHPRLVPVEPANTTVSYFLGNDPAQWQPDVPVWHSVRYDDLYPEVDLVITTVGGAIELRQEARAGAHTPVVWPLPWTQKAVRM